MVVKVLTIAILYLLEDDEGERVKMSFFKKKKKIDGIFVNYMNLWGEQGKTNFLKKKKASFVFDFELDVNFTKKKTSF